MLTAFIEINLKKNLGKFVPYLAIFEGIVTAWIPGLFDALGQVVSIDLRRKNDAIDNARAGKNDD